MGKRPSAAVLREVRAAKWLNKGGRLPQVPSGAFAQHCFGISGEIIVFGV
jgi:hypothetical protein